MTEEEAIKATRGAAFMAFLSAAVTCAMVSYFIFSQDDTIPALNQVFGDPSYYFDVIFIVFLGVGLFKRSRTAAIALIGYWLLSKVFIFIELGKFSAGSLLFLYFYIKGARGAFAYHKIQKEKDPTYKAAPKWVYFAGIPLLLVFLAAILFGLMTMTGFAPPTEVLAGNRLPSNYHQELVQEGVIEQDETIEMFYSEGLFSIMEGGNILTNKRVISYENQDDTLQISQIPYENVEQIDLVHKGSFVDETVVEVYPYEGQGLRLFLSTEKGGDEKFIEHLKSKLPLPAK